MSQVLYRKYRPQKFADVAGQEPIVTTLLNALKGGHTAHAYLFSGPRGTGKTSIARILAKAVNCLKLSNGEPDGKCANCIAVTEQSAIDLIEIDAASHTQVDKMRDLIDKVRFAPSDLITKVYIIDEVHMLSAASFNALLKTLEEPPEHTIFILATTEIHKVPSTVISRTQRFDFRRIGMGDLSERLTRVAKSEGIEIDKKAVDLIAAASEGGFRDALSLLDQLRAYAGDKISLEAAESMLGVTDYDALETFTEHIAARNTREAIILLNNLVNEGYDLIQFAKAEMEYLRKVLLAKMAGLREGEMPAERQEKVDQLKELLKEEEILNAIELISAAGKEVKFSPVPQLPFELAVVKMTIGEASAGGKTVIVQPIMTQNQETRIKKHEEAKTEEISAEKQGKNIKSDSWEQILSRIKQEHSSIAASLQLSEPSITEEEMVLTFEYKFHKERIDEKKNKELIERVAEEVLGKSVKLITALKERAMPTSVEEIEEGKKQDLLESALEVLGGEIVEEEEG